MSVAFEPVVQGAGLISHVEENSEPTWEQSYELVEMDSCLFV
jgi:hypothetical protein